MKRNQSCRAERPSLEPGLGRRVEEPKKEPRRWWFTERMHLGLVQLFAALGGVFFPVMGLIRSASGRSIVGAVLSSALFVTAAYALVETRFLTEIETAADGARLAAGAVVLVGMIGTGLFLMFLVGAIALVFLLVWPVLFRSVRGSIVGLVRLVLRAIGIGRILNAEGREDG